MTNANFMLGVTSSRPNRKVPPTAGGRSAKYEPPRMTTDFAELAEIVRIPSPAPAPQALACDGEHLWLGSWETARIYGIYANQGRVFEEVQAPGKPVGATVVG